MRAASWFVWLPVAAAAIGCKTADKAATNFPITERILLRYHPPAGATYGYVLDQTSRIAPDTTSSDSGNQNVLHLAFHQTIDAATAESVAVTSTLDSARVSSPMLSPSATADAVKRMQGVKVTAVVDNQQRVIRNDWSGVNRLPGVIGDQLQLVFRAAAVSLPEDSVKAGDSWSNTVELPFGQVAGGAPLTAKTKVTIRDLSVQAGDTIARLVIATGVPDRPMRFSFGGQSITVLLMGTITGEQTLSVSRGALVEATLGGTMLVRVTGGIFGPQGMTMRVDQQGAMHLVPP
jgi:hypothetical protein